MTGKLMRGLEQGLERVRWFASLLGERLRVELAVMRLLWQSFGLEKKRGGIASRIGERVYELRRQEELNLMGDKKIRKELKELEAVVAEIKEIRQRVARIGEEEDG